MSARVVVVGAGPAGSAAALCLARAGVSVLLIDRVELPRRKVCGACIGPAARDALDRLGLLSAVLDRGAVPVDVMELRAGRRRARISLRGNLALSRSALDDLLAGAAAEAGAAVRLGVRVETVRLDGDGVELTVRSEGVEDRIRACAVVDATGLGGGLDVEAPRSDDAGERVAPASRIGIGAVYARSGHDLGDGQLRMIVGDSGYVGIVRVEGARLNVAAAVDREALSTHGPEGAVARLLEGAGARLPDDPPVEPWRGTPALTRRPGKVARERVLRVGDAAGYVEPFTGEGIGWAIMSGVAVAAFAARAASDRGDAVAVGWTRTHRRLIAHRQRACRVLAAALRRPRLVRVAVGVLSVVPFLANPVVESIGRPGVR